MSRASSGAETVYDALRDPTDQSLPRCLRTMKVYEANLHTQFTTFSAHLVGRLGVSQSVSQSVGH